MLSGNAKYVVWPEHLWPRTFSPHLSSLVTVKPVWRWPLWLQPADMSQPVWERVEMSCVHSLLHSSLVPSTLHFGGKDSQTTNRSRLIYKQRKREKHENKQLQTGNKQSAFHSLGTGCLAHCCCLAGWLMWPVNLAWLSPNTPHYHRTATIDWLMCIHENCSILSSTPHLWVSIFGPRANSLVIRNAFFTALTGRQN